MVAAVAMDEPHTAKSRAGHHSGHGQTAPEMPDQGVRSAVKLS